MSTIFMPVPQHQCVQTHTPFLDPITARFQDKKFGAYGLPPGLFGSLKLQSCSTSIPKSHLSKSQPGPFPLIIFSPALGTTRLFYSNIAQSLASTGYVVVTVDHPYDVDIVTFPDNSTILGLDIPDSELSKALDTRVKDVSFVITQTLELKVLRQHLVHLSQFCGSMVDATRIGVFGHSFGGAAAAESMLQDKRVMAGIDLDGSFFGDVVQRGTKKPLLILAHDGKNRSTDPSWEAIWPRLKGWRQEVMLEGFAHYTFSDLPIVVDALGLKDVLPPQVSELLGSVDGKAAEGMVRGYLTAFFDKFLKNKKHTLLG